MRMIFADDKSEFEAIAGLAERGGARGLDVEQAVRQIIEDVRAQGDAAVLRYTRRFDGPDATPGGRIGQLSRQDLKAAFESLSTPLADALLHAAENIRAYHIKQVESLKGYEVKYPCGFGAGSAGGIMPGADGEDAAMPGTYGEGAVVIGQVVRGLSRVGVYVPGGTAAYPSTVLMDVIPAKLAGVGEIVMVTPPRKRGEVAGTGSTEARGGEAEGTGTGSMGTGDGGTGGAGPGGMKAGDGGTRSEPDFGTDAVILGAAYIAGVDRVLLAGGGQAVAALAFGTETFPRVDKIVGPGNIYVATAKRLLYGVVDIEMIAGPSDILVIADETADAAFVAADLLSQAEHDPDSASILLTTSRGLAAEAAAQVATQLKQLDRAGTARKSIEQNGLIIVCRSEEEMIRLANEIAPEHIEIMTRDPFAVLTGVRNAGSVFLGPWTPEPVGDYYSGTNHVLPTNGTARFASPLGVYDFVKRMSYTRYTEAALRGAKDDILEISNSEGLTAHANAVKIRFDR